MMCCFSHLALNMEDFKESNDIFLLVKLHYFNDVFNHMHVIIVFQ